MMCINTSYDSVCIIKCVHHLLTLHHHIIRYIVLYDKQLHPKGASPGRFLHPLQQTHRLHLVVHCTLPAVPRASFMQLNKGTEIIEAIERERERKERY